MGKRGIREMETGDRHQVIRLLTERRNALPRPALKFIDLLRRDDVLLGRMHLCRPVERSRVSHSVWISHEQGCWSVLLGNDPEGGNRSAQSRARLALEGLDLSPSEVAERLRAVPVWFLAVDPDVALPPAGEAARLERTVMRLSALSSEQVRRTALLDQIDAALEARDTEAAERLRRLLS